MNARWMVILSLLMTACDSADLFPIVNSRAEDIAVYTIYRPHPTQLNHFDFTAFIASGDTGYAVVVNRIWREVLETEGSLTLIALPGDSVDRYGRGALNELIPLYEAHFTLHSLDSLGWIVTIE